MNQAPESINARSQDAAARELHSLALNHARERMRFYRSHVPPLRADDPVGMTIGDMTDWWLGTHKPGARLNKAMLRRNDGLAIRYAVGADQDYAIAAGVLPRFRSTCEQLWLHIGRWFDSWSERQMEALDRCMDDDAEVLTPREHLIRRFAAIPLAIAVPRNQLIASVRRACEQLDGEWGRQPTPGEGDDVDLAGTLMIAASKPGGLQQLLGVDGSGKLFLRDWAVRDNLGKRGRYRPRFAALGDFDHGGFDCSPGSGQDVNQMQDVLKAVRAVAARRAARFKAGSARHVVLESFVKLAFGKVSVTQLAAESGLSISSVSRAWTLEREAIAKDDAVRRAGAGF